MKKIFLGVFFLTFFSINAQAKVQTKEISYTYAGVTMKGHLAWDDAAKGKLPGVLVVHEFWGLNDYAKGRAEQLASMGYVAFAADMYGAGKVATHPEDAMAMMGAVRKNLKTWIGRGNAALKVLSEQPNVDTKRLAAIGYCFGGATVLQLAYNGADLKSVVSFHGALVVPETTQKIRSRILILHGANDPHVLPETVNQLKAAFDKGNVNYKFISYPGVVHSFTVPSAGNDPKKGVAYNAKADKNSWKEMKKLFAETLK